MGSALFATEGFTGNPVAGFSRHWPDSGNSLWFQRNAAGVISGEIFGAITAQIAAHSIDTYYKGLQLPSFSMRTGTVFEWEFKVSKGAVGVATPIYQIRIGAAGAIADTSRLTLTGVLQSAAADNGVVKITVTCRSVGAAGIIVGSAEMKHNLATTGLASGATSPAGYNLVEAASAGFDNQSTAIAGFFVGLSVNPGAAGAWVVEQCFQRITF